MTEQDKKYIRQSSRILTELNGISAHFPNELIKQINQCLERHRKTISDAYQTDDRPAPSEWR